MHGFQTLFTRKQHSSKYKKTTTSPVEDLDLSRLVCCTYELLRRQHMQVKVKEDLEERYFRSSSLP